MYLDFYGLTDTPFSITPNPRYVFLSKHHREVFAHLLFGIRQRAGFIEVTGEVGTGKTTVLRTLFLELEKEDARIAYIFNPCLSAQDLLRTVNREFGIIDQAPTSDLHAALNTFLLHENAAGRTVILVIDEAQNLTIEVLEQVRLLSNLETETEKLIQIILVGQPELGSLLDRQELRQLNQRITVRYHLKAMDCDETSAYIEHRLSIAGWSRGQLFTPEGLRKIYQVTRGNPRMINVLCDRALLVGYAENLQSLDLPVIRRAAKEIRRQPVFLSGTPGMIWFSLLIPIIVLIYWLYPQQDLADRQIPPSTYQEPERKDLGIDFLTPLRQGSIEDHRLQAINSLLNLWGGKDIQTPADSMEEALYHCREQKFEATRLQGDLTALSRIQLPLLLEIDERPEPRYVLYMGQSINKIQLILGNGTMTTVTRPQIEPHLSGRAYLLWKNPLNIPVSKSPLHRSEDLVALQTLLNSAGKHVTLSGRYDESTKAAIRSFQMEEDLTIDGMAGLQTLIALYRESQQYGYPLQSPGGKE